MAQVTKYVCDGCGITKGETNHWFAIRLGVKDGVVTGYAVSTFELLGAARYPESEHYCGERCTQKRESELKGLIR